MSRPVVSVVIPAFMAERFIAEALRSVTEQSWRPLEVVVVDDASPDGTTRVVDSLRPELANAGVQLVLVRVDQNGGAAAALARGCREASGQQLAWLSADDAFAASGKLALQVATGSIGGARLAYSRVVREGPSADSVRSRRPSWVPRLPFLDGLFDRWPSWRVVALMFRNPVNGSSTLFDRALLDQAGSFDADLRNIDADADLWLRWSILGVPFRGVRGAAVFYRVHGAQTSAAEASMKAGGSMTRLRVLLALEDTGRLESLVARAWPVLIMGVLTPGPLRFPGAVHHLGGSLRRGRKPAMRLLGRVVLWRTAAAARSGMDELVAQSRELMHTDEFNRFLRLLERRDR